MKTSEQANNGSCGGDQMIPRALNSDEKSIPEGQQVIAIPSSTTRCSDKSDGHNGHNKQTQDQVEQLDETSNKSFINIKLIPLKAILFAWYAACACLLPFMVLHMYQLGMTEAEVAAINTILPFIQLLGTPIAAFIADRTGNYRSVLIISLFVCLISSLLIQFAVPAREMQPILVSQPDATNGTETADGNDATRNASTFWLYFVIRAFHQIGYCQAFVLLDATTVVLTKQHGSDYGKQRFWAILAAGLSSPICGFMIEYLSSSFDEKGMKIKNYDPAFYSFEALAVFTIIVASVIDMEVSSLPTNVWSNIRPLVKSANVWVFLISILIMGSSWGFLESYLFVFLRTLNAPSYLMGLTVTVGAFIGLPFLYCSEWVVDKVGAVQLLLVALVVYFIRLVGYSLIENPWWCMPYELMEVFTVHLMWVATVRLATQIAPPGLLATLQAVVGSLNFGAGRGVGSLIGGSTKVFYDDRVAFRVVGGISLAFAILYAILHYCVLPPLEVVTKDEKGKAKLENNSSQPQSTEDIELAKRVPKQSLDPK